MCSFHIFTISFTFLNREYVVPFGHLINWHILQRIQAWSVTVLKGLKHQTLTGGQSATCECHLSKRIFPFSFGSNLNDDFSAWVYSVEDQESTVFSELKVTAFRQRLSFCCEKNWASWLQQTGLGFHWCTLCDCGSVDIKSNSISMGLLMTYAASKRSKDKALGKKFLLVTQSGFQLLLLVVRCSNWQPARLRWWMLENSTSETLIICMWWERKGRKGRGTSVLRCSRSNFENHCGAHRKKQQLRP